MSGQREVCGILLTEVSYPSGHWVPSHTHEHPFFSFCLKGEVGKFRQTGEERQSRILYHPSGEVHLGHRPEGCGKSLYVELGPAMQRRLNECGTPISRFTFNGPLIHRLFVRLYKEFHEKDAVSGVAIEGLVLEMLAQCSRDSLAPRKTGVPRWLTEAHDIVHDGYANRLRLSEIAKRVGVHPVYLATEFRRLYGCSIGDYVRWLKVEKACAQLASSAAPLVEIAADLGFSHQAHFSRTFKRCIGLTPSEYRKRMRP